MRLQIALTSPRGPIVTETTARQDWEQRIGLPSDRPLTGIGELPPPSGLTATAGPALVHPEGQPVDGALGYLVHRATSADGPFTPLDHLGGDVLAVPHPP